MNRSDSISAKFSGRLAVFPSFLILTILVCLIFTAQAIPRLDGKTYRILQICLRNILRTQRISRHQNSFCNLSFF